MATVKSNYVFGIRCSDGKREMLYLTSEKTDDASSINALKPKLMVRIDKNKVHALEAEADVIDNKLRVVAELSGGVVEEIRDAKQRIAVVLNVIGQNFHENSFNVRGSTNAAKKLIATCK